MDINLTATGLIDLVAQETGLDHKTVKTVWQNSLQVMQDVLLAHGTVQLRNIGRLKVREMPSHNHYDINTGQTVMVPGQMVLAVRTSKRLKEMLGSMPDDECQARQVAWDEKLQPYHRYGKHTRKKKAGK